MRAPLGFALPFLLLLALATALNSASLGALHALLWKPLPYARPDALVELRFDLRDAGLQVGLSHLLYERLRADDAVFDGLVGSIASRPLHDAAGQPWALQRITADFTEVLGVQPARGRGLADLAPDTAASALLLSAAAARRHYGSAEAALGQRLRLLDTDYTVVGVMPRGFSYPDAGVDGWRVYQPSADEQAQDEMGGFGLYTVLGRLAEGQTAEAARASLARHLAQAPEFARLRNSGAAVAPEARAWSQRYLGGHREGLLVLQSAVGLLLLGVAANLGLLVLMRTLARRREYAMRRVLGAAFVDLLRAMLAELKAPIALGLALGLALSPLCAHALAALGLLPATLPDADGQPWAGPLLALAAVGLALGLALLATLPALRAVERPDPQHYARSPRRSRLRNALLVLQIGLAVVLSGSAGLLLRSASLLEAQELGFDPTSRVVTRIDLDDLGGASPETAMQRVDEALAALPGVRAAAYTDALPFGDSYFLSRIELPAGELKVRRHGVGAGYFEAMGMRLLRGRDFAAAGDGTATDARRAQAPGEVVIDTRLARRAFGEADPIGRRLRIDEDGQLQERVVVGVVAPIKFRSLAEDGEEAAIYEPLTSPGSVHYRVHHVAGDPTAMAERIRQALLQAEPRVLIGLHGPLQTVIAGTLEGRRALLQLGIGISLCVLLLTAFGLYAALQLSVLERRSEFGVRLALGAAPGRVLRLVLARCAALLAAGVALGLPLGLLAAHGLGAQLYGVRATDPGVWTAALSCVALVVLLAGLPPAWRAARIAPRSALEGAD
jgi:putative ABC transport system permease protein